MIITVSLCYQTLSKMVTTIDPLFPIAIGMPLKGEDSCALAVTVASAAGLPSL